MTRMYRVTILLAADDDDMTGDAYPDRMEAAVRETVRDGAFNVEAWAPADDIATAGKETDHMPRRRRYVKVKTADYLKHPDMVRYISYRDVDATPEPIVVDWHGSRCTVHRIDAEDGFTYLRQPSQYNTAWGEQAVARYRSFGVRAEIVLR